ncbi:MAG: sigma-54-dependent Fis family transcriptional regulator [Deltaproteobacteria bacterium]|nr:MAG: sigma-54-dependent Fis family transcriptional regulator [Deltaproteobacteria bacterium]
MAAVLVIDDNDTIRDGVAAVVQRLGHKVYTAADGRRGVEQFAARHIDFTITDLKMEGLDGIGVLKEVLARDQQAVVMVITAYGTVETAVEAMKLGAFDFITKPFTPDVLRAKTEQALEVARLRRQQARLEQENRLLRDQVLGQSPEQEMVGRSPPMQQVLATIRKVAPSDSTVLISGASGTGKELVARALHSLSRRARGPFIPVNCAALAETLLESELFGHEKGAFTGAGRRKLGRFELADGGTIFLDEVSEIPPPLQVKLLRVLQEREFERVGGEQTISVDTRVIAATNQDLQARVAAGRFRQDLFYRLHIVPIQLPPLRERRQDIPLLVEHFLGKLARRTGKNITAVEPAALQMLQDYPWPGNVRELENVVEQAMVFAEGDTIRTGDLPSALCQRAAPEQAPGADPGLSVLPGSEGLPLPQILEQLERRLILQAYQKANRVKTETARLLGIKPSALYYKLEKYEID